MSVLDSHQWFKNGDHPDDGPAEQEGAVVRYFRHPDHPGTLSCPHCHTPLHGHGWIDSGGDGRTVCPGDIIVILDEGQAYPLKPDLHQALLPE